uniref:Rho termination factor N-terminal domain-containing protein n=1 Tax=Novisyntrophococcus fermenticellae TaxID=2068655 RepID=UPI002FE6F335
MLDKAGLKYGPEAADETETEDETETAEQTETTEETKNSDFSEEQLEAMTVVELRKLARDIEITNMTRQEIRFARKQELIHAILDFNINKGQER